MKIWRMKIKINKYLWFALMIASALLGVIIGVLTN